MRLKQKPFWNSTYFVWLSVAAVILGLCIIQFQTSNPIAVDEGLRHIVMAAEYKDNGIFTVKGWGDYFFTGYFAKHNSDPWFLAHLTYIPFTLFASPIIGLKLYTVTLVLLLLTCFYPLLRYYKTSPLLTALFLLGLPFGSVTFLSRLVIARPLVFSIGAFLLSYNAILRKQYWQLIPIIAIAVLFSHLFLFALFIGLSTSLWLLWQKRYAESVYCSIASLLGVAIGIALHPETGEYLHYLVTVFFGMVFGTSDLLVGGEVLSGLINPDIALWLIIIALFSSACSRYRKAFIRELVQKRPEIILTSVYTLIFLLCYIKMMRTVEYLYPILLILLLQIITLTRKRQKAVETYLHEPVYPKGRITVLHTMLILFCLTLLTATLNERGNSKYNILERYSAIEQVPPGSRVLNIEWSPFPILFYLNHEVLYARGMAPHLDDSTILFDKTIDHWKTMKKLKELGFERAKQEFRERMTKKGFYLIREAQELDVEKWLLDIRETYDPDVILLTKGTHPQLIMKLAEIKSITLFAQSPAIVIFAFADTPS